MTELLLDGRDATTEITDDELSSLTVVHGSCLLVQQVLAMLAFVVQGWTLPSCGRVISDSTDCSKLQESRSPPDERDGAGWTAFHWAIRRAEGAQQETGAEERGCTCHLRPGWLSLCSLLQTWPR